MNISIANCCSSPSIYNKPNDSVDPYVHLIVSMQTAAFTLNLLLNLPTNVYISWLIMTGAGSLVASDFFALNLAVSEILFCLSNVLHLIQLRLPSNDILYTAAQFAQGILHAGRPLFQCCICLERYMAVVHPVVFLRYRPLRYRLVCSGLVWVVVFGCCLAEMFLRNGSKTKSYYLFISLLTCLSVKLFCFLAVLRALRRPGPGEGGDREGKNTIKRKAFRIIMVTTVAMLINYLPYIFTVPLEHTMERRDFGLAIFISFSLCVISGVVQSLLYLHRVGKLQCMREP